ncbi:branched-chain amino acid ABC transporter permease [Bosea sp. (in: a-proteobacteria)]|uniref:branched-chain amino acid ABC transporter permease n=1 Tax=Bosea sp. (in: a-proteobacteria) TaxID=1871050 RepID=UPI003B3A2114
MALVVAGLSVGSIYALIAITLNLTFWTTKTVNFGQGSILMLCAMATVFMAGAGLPIWMASLLGIAAAAITMVAAERISVRPVLKAAGSMGWAVSTLGFGILIQGIVSKYLGTQAVAFPDVVFSSSAFVQVFGIRIGLQYVVVFGFSLATICLLELALHRTVWGRVVRAVAQDRELASLFGIPVSRVVIVSFALSGALAGVAGILTAQIIGTVDPAFGFNLLISGFVAGIVGGFGRNWGALAGGLLIGVLEQVVGGYVSTAAGHGISLAVLVLMLSVRPQGLFGQEEAVKV